MTERSQNPSQNLSDASSGKLFTKSAKRGATVKIIYYFEHCRGFLRNTMRKSLAVYYIAAMTLSDANMIYNCIKLFISQQKGEKIL